MTNILQWRLRCMHIRSKLYPYPVLTSFNDDYIDSYFNINIVATSTSTNLILTLSPDLDNDEIKHLIQQGKAYYSIHVECPLTSFRKFYKLNNQVEEIKISADDIDGVVNICPFIVLQENVYDYTNEKFNSVYDGITFDLDKGSIIAIGYEQKASIEKESDDLNNVPSIFAVTELKSETDKDIIIDNTENKINIRLPSSSFVEFKIAQSNPNSMAIIHSMIIVPALMKCFDDIKVKAQNDSLYELEEKRWYKVIKKALGKCNIDLNEETAIAIDSFALSQKIMNNTTNRAICGINAIAFQGDTVDE